MWVIGVLALAGCPGKSPESSPPADAAAPSDEGHRDGAAGGPGAEAGPVKPGPDAATDASSTDASATCAMGTVRCNGACLGAGQTAGNCTVLLVDDNVGRIARAGQYLYYSIIVGGAIKRIPVAGGAPESVAPLRPNAMTGDATHLYFYTGALGGEVPMIRRVPVAGGPVQDLTSTPAAPTALAIDGSHVYFVREGGFNGFMDVYGPAVHRLPLAGGPITDIAIASKPDWVGVDGTDVYWADKGVVWKTAKATAGMTPLGDGGASAGGAVKVIDTRSFATGVPYAVDAEHVYWPAGGALSRAPKAGGGMAEEVATEVDDLPFGYPTADATDVYLSTVSFGPVNRLIRFHKADRTTKVLATWDGGPIDIDDTHVYLRASGGILKIAK